MIIEHLLNMFDQYGEKEAIIWNEQSYSYRWLCRKTREWQEFLQDYDIGSARVVALEGDYSPFICSMLFALIGNNHVVVPLSTTVTPEEKKEFLKLANVQCVMRFNNLNELIKEDYSYEPDHPLIRELIKHEKPGLVLFSSGSTGKSKGIVHDLTVLLDKYQKKGKGLRSLVFLLLDHIGGINTLFSILSSGGTMIVQNSRNPSDICYAIEKHRVELLPTTPTFLNLLILSEAYKEYDLSSLKMITYGTEPMPELTLKKATEIFPGIQFKQTYGLSELGIVGTRSESDSSLWVQLGGKGFTYKIVHDILWIKAETSMLGYLNAPCPFDEEGWFNTQDVVLQKDGYIKILGRETEIINVGGQKVYPAEVENVLMELDNIRDVSVRGEQNPIMGSIVSAKVNLLEPEELQNLKRRIRLHCLERLESYKIPIKIELTEESLFGERFKKMRR